MAMYIFVYNGLKNKGVNKKSGKFPK